MSDIITRDVSADTSENHNNLDQMAANRALEVLLKHYPGYDWYISVEGGVIKIRNMNLSNTHGFVQRMDEVSPTDFDEKVMLAGGEILERFGMPTGKFKLDVFAELPRDFRGVPLRDAS